MAGWFELNKSKDDQFRFVLKSDDNEILLSSELYKVCLLYTSRCV